MDELVKLVASKTGLSDGHARIAVETVLSFVKGRLPSPLASQIDALLATGAHKASEGGLNVGGLDVGNLGGALGSLFGDKK